MRRDGFTLIELLVAVAVIALLLGLMMPALGSARETAHRAVCMTNQRQLVIGWGMYAEDHRGKALPHAAPSTTRRVYWYGAEDPARRTIVRQDGTLGPYIEAALTQKSVFECPTQRQGTYREQGSYGGFTTTYGYNAYTLAPASSGYMDLASLRWPAVFDIYHPAELFVFGDTLLALHADAPTNTALLDPPQLFNRRRGIWRDNHSPTTAFRHARDGTGFGDAVVSRADGSVHSQRPDLGAVANPRFGIGSVSRVNDPHYVPDWRRW
jgi:prepilin-type N-terminal cleavage/methylation domain-containing protein